jgi:hypothetical protein
MRSEKEIQKTLNAIRAIIKSGAKGNVTWEEYLDDVVLALEWVLDE